MTRKLRFAGLAATMVLAACGLGDAPEPALPADAVLVRVYTNGGERFPETVRWRFQSAELDRVGDVHGASHDGVVSWIPEGTCIAIRPVWNLSVTTQEPGADPLVNAVAHSGNFSGETPLDLAIERRPNGTVSVTEGVPDWWEGKPIGCASN